MNLDVYRAHSAPSLPGMQRAKSDLYAGAHYLLAREIPTKHTKVPYQVAENLRTQAIHSMCIHPYIHRARCYLHVASTVAMTSMLADAVQPQEILGKD